MVRALAVSDEVESWALVTATARPGVDLVVAAGDLPFDYLAGIVDRVDRPGVLVPGNHDPEIDDPLPGWVDADGQVVDVAGLRIAGLGGCVRYRPGPNQWTEREQAGHHASIGHVHASKPHPCGCKAHYRPDRGKNPARS